MRDSGTQSTPMSTEQPGSSVPTSPKATPSPATYHQSCETLRYARFVDIMCGGPRQLLVISGEVEESVLEDAWQQILSEYSTLIRTDKSATVFEAYKNMVGCGWKMQWMELALKLLRSGWEAGLGHNPEIAEKIMLLGYNLIEDREDTDQYVAQLDAVEMESRSLVVFFNQYKAQYEALAPKAEKVQEERDRMSYEKELNLLGQSQGFLIDPETTTVLKYASYVNFYLETHKKES